MSSTKTVPLAGFEDASCHIVSFPMERVTRPRTGGPHSQLGTKALGSCSLQGTECRQQPGELGNGSFPSRASRCGLAEDPGKPCMDSGPTNCEPMHWCCFKLLCYTARLTNATRLINTRLTSTDGNGSLVIAMLFDYFNPNRGVLSKNPMLIYY